MPASASARFTSAARSGAIRIASQPWPSSGSPPGPFESDDGVGALEAAERRPGSLHLVRQEPHPHPARRLEELVERALVDEVALVDDPHDVGELLDLGRMWLETRIVSAGVGEVAHLCPEAVDPGRVEAVGRLVEDEQLRVVQRAAAIPSRWRIPSE